VAVKKPPQRREIDPLDLGTVSEKGTNRRQEREGPP